MGLQDEIESLVGPHLTKLDSTRNMNLDYHERQRSRFAPIGRTIRDILKINSDVVAIVGAVEDEAAMIAIGMKRNNGSFEEDVKWVVEPNYSADFGTSGEVVYKEQAGFRVKEQTFLYYPNYESTETNYVLCSENDTILHILNHISQTIARYKHIADGSREGNRFLS